mmetsp:Transcript_7832/g.11824  ORF Transcript_7832/g.11824 Transcript_7832/m.11824 type:complete len:222 (+) Transcript_7832:49-714(+)
MVSSHSISPYRVFFYYPNIIGYLRIILVMICYYLAKSNWQISSIFYTVAFAGDLMDGYVARKYNQSSSFGAALDMITDRCSTSGILFVLSNLYTDYYFYFLSLMFLDILSHWLHIQSVANKGHHKSAGSLKGRNRLIRLFYSSYPFFGYCNVFTEFFYIGLYLMHFNKALSIFGLFQVNLKIFTFYICLPACLCKQAVNVAQLCAAAYSMAEEDVANKQNK